MRSPVVAPLVQAPLATATSSAGRHLELSYKQHTAVDDRAGIVVDVEIVTGEEPDHGKIAERLTGDACEFGLARHFARSRADRDGEVILPIEGFG